MRDCDCYWGCAVIKVSDLWAEVKKVAAERPDYVYSEEPCQYQYDGKPSCIVGHALHRLGVSIEALEALDAAQEGGGVPASGLPSYLPILVEEGSRSALLSVCEAQEAQDDGIPWGEAVGGVE